MQCDVKLGHRESGAGDERAPFDLESMLLLQHPILPPNPSFLLLFQQTSYHGCRESIKSDLRHILRVSLFSELQVRPFSSLSCVSSSGCFCWNIYTLCHLQVVQTLSYSLLFTPGNADSVCGRVYFSALLCDHKSVLFVCLPGIRCAFKWILNLSTTVWIFGLMAGFMLLTLFFLYSSLLFWFDYQFIAEVDRFLKSIQKSSSNASKDDQNGGNGRDYINQQI